VDWRENLCSGQKDVYGIDTGGNSQGIFAMRGEGKLALLPFAHVEIRVFLPHSGKKFTRHNETNTRSQGRVNQIETTTTMSHEELELLAIRYSFFHVAGDEALQVVHDHVDWSTYGEIYNTVEREWKATGDTNPLARFPLNDRDKQEEFFRAVEDVCRGVNKIRGDYPAYVSFISHPSYVLTAVRQARPRVFRCIYGRVRYHHARSPVSQRVAPSLHNHRSGNTPHVGIPSLASSHAPSNNFPRSATNMSRISAREQPPASTMLYKTKAFKKWPTLELGSIISHTRPGSDERFECTVVDFGTSKAKGDWFLVTYTGNPDMEIQLSDSEMGEILAHGITVA